MSRVQPARRIIFSLATVTPSSIGRSLALPPSSFSSALLPLELLTRSDKQRILPWLRLVVKSVHARQIAFRNQLRLGLKPVLHVVPLLRALVHISEIRSSGDLILGGRELIFESLLFLNRGQTGRDWRLLISLLVELVVFHKAVAPTGLKSRSAPSLTASRVSFTKTADFS